MNYGPQGGLSLLRILGSLSRTINIVRQIAPIYKDVKPLLEKAPLLFERINSIRNRTYTLRQNIQAPLDNMAYNEPTKSSSGPNFFR